MSGFNQFCKRKIQEVFIQFLLFIKFDDINTKEYYLLKNILL